MAMFTHRIRSLLLAALCTAAVAAWAHEGEAHDALGTMHNARHGVALGQPGDATKVSRVIEVEMSDNMRFNPAAITVQRGETIRFVAGNTGKVIHEMVLGTRQELKEHATLMRKFPEMQHADPNQISVKPGETGELIWRFTNAGTFYFACLIPGHFEAGMVGKITVRR